MWEATPLMVDGVLYVSTSLSQVAAIEAATGKTRVDLRPGDVEGRHALQQRLRASRRRLLGRRERSTHPVRLRRRLSDLLERRDRQARLHVRPEGRIDLTQGLGRTVDRRHYGVSSPPIVCRDVVVMGSKIHDVPVAHSRCHPAMCGASTSAPASSSGSFRAVPGEGEFGNETWEEGSWKTTGSANVWTLMSADDELGYVYLPFSTPSNDWYGGERPGDGLFGESLVCLDARTGKRVWHFQIVHHGLWDYDLPAAPNLIDVRVNGTLGQGRGSGDQAGVRLRVRSRDRPADLADRRAPRPAVHGARREDITDAALPDETRAVRSAGRHRERRRRLHAGVAQGSAGRPGEVQLRSAVHAAFAREADHRDARLGGRRELGWCGMRPRDRDDVRAVDHERVGGHDGESTGAVSPAP